MTTLSLEHPSIAFFFSCYSYWPQRRGKSYPVRTIVGYSALILPSICIFLVTLLVLMVLMPQSTSHISKETLFVPRNCSKVFTWSNLCLLSCTSEMTLSGVYFFFFFHQFFFHFNILWLEHAGDTLGHSMETSITCQELSNKTVSSSKSLGRLLHDVDRSYKDINE